MRGWGIGLTALVAVAAVGIVSLFVNRDDSAVQLAGSRGSGNGDQLSRLADDCASAAEGEEAAAVEIRGSLTISNETGELQERCRIRLVDGAELILNNVELTSGHLIIDDGQEPAADEVRINNSTLTGSDAGVLVDLDDPADVVRIDRSEIDYDRSVWVRVAGFREDAVGGGRLDVTQSTIRSVGEETEGIQLIAGDVNGGEAIFNQLTVETDAEVGTLLMAEECTANKVEGAPEECEPPDADDFTD